MSSTKRKSDASTSASTKKARKTHTAAIESVRSILADTGNFAVPEDSDETRRALLELALYARSLEEQVQASKPKEKTAEEVEAAADKLSAAVRSGIRKQMGVSILTVASLRYNLTHRLVEAILQNWFCQVDI
jgi:nanoRNase/pAp phosphatase (c-di-AMP/oligoRNAs hydrolase)